MNEPTDLTADPNALELMQACVDDARQNTARLERDKADWLALLNYRGGVDNTWVVWDRSSNSWVPRPYDGDDAALPEWVPRACTNVFATKIDGITALLDQSEPAQEWRPVTDDDSDVAASEVIESAMPALFEEINYDTLRRQIHKHITLLDKVALHVYYDANTGPEQVIPSLLCPQCGEQYTQLEVDEAGECPGCGGEAEAMTMPPANPDGTPAGQAYQVGQMKARLHPSFEFSLPRSARMSDEREVPWILLHTRFAKEDAVKTWPNAKELIESAARGGTGNAGVQRQYADAMARLSAPSAARSYGTVGAADPMGPIVYQLFHDPTEAFPKGLYAVMINESMVEAGPLPHADDDGKPVKNVLLRSFALAPGTPFNKPPADDLVPLQYWRNLIESLIALSLLHNAAPRTWTPLSVILEDQPTGRPGEQVRFRSQVPGERPITERGQGADSSAYEYLRLIDEKMEEVSKLNAVLMGNRPSGDPTLGEVQILQERGMAAFKTPLDTLVEFELRLSRLLLLIARQSAWSPRFRAIKGEDGQWAVDQFAFTNLKGHVDVFCEPASAWPKSPLMMNLKIKEAVGMGALQPAQDPELASKMLTLLDLNELKPSQNVVRKQIARQLDRWKAAQYPEQVMDPADTAAVPQPWWGLEALHQHLMHKSQFLMTEEVEQLARQNPPLYEAMKQHVQQIQQLIQLMMAPPPEEGGDEQEGEPEPPAQGSEDDALQQAIDSGVLKPAGQAEAEQAQGLPSIDDLVRSRILEPVMPPAAPPS